MKRVASYVLVIGFCLLLLSACVTNKDGDVMKQDIIALKTELESVQQNLNGYVEKNDEQMSTVRKDLDKTMHNNRLTTASDHLELSRIQRDLKMLNGMIEKNGFNLDQLDMKLQKQVADLEKRVLVLEAKLGVASPDQKKQQTQQIIETPIEAVPDDDPKGLYDKAKALIVKQKNTVESRRLMAIFLKKHGDDKLADNAQYWIGESYYQEKNYHQAVMEFQKVADKYPKGDAVDDALYMLGECFRSLGMKDDAKLFYEECIDRFPKTGSAKKARAAIKKL